MMAMQWNGVKMHVLEHMYHLRCLSGLTLACHGLGLGASSFLDSWNVRCFVPAG